VNTDDRDVPRFLALFTFLPMSEIHNVASLEGAALNGAKTILAYEATQLAHGKDEATKAFQAACQMFGTRMVPENILPSSGIPRQDAQDANDSVPSTEMAMANLDEGVAAFKLFHQVGLVKSSAEARRLISQGGAYVNGRRIETYDEAIKASDLQDMALVLRAGKKRFHKIIIKS
jgi:tyrosyl-tRNA synthetase